jgi:DNA-3-methyladenine glycosylase
VEVARDLVGCVLSHGETAGVIVETEAYHETEAACHAYVGVTRRTATLFGAPGTAYVYRSYGIHALFNAVCEGQGVGAAVLVRALEPVAGLSVMRRRRGLDGERALCSGPGKLTVALGVELGLNQSNLVDGPIAVWERPAAWRAVAIVADRRIGITKAAELPWRFCAGDSRYLSRPVAALSRR